MYVFQCGFCVELFLMTDANCSALSEPKIGSFNCNGLSNKQKKKLVLNVLKSKPEELFFLQETHSTPKTEKEWEKLWWGKNYLQSWTMVHQIPLVWRS